MKWIFGTLILLLVAYIFDMGLLIYALYALLGVLIASRGLTALWTQQLHATRTISAQELKQGETLEVTIELENRGGMPIAWSLIEDLLPAEALVWRPPRIEIVGKRLGLVRLWGHEKQRWTYECRCNRRGYYQIGPLVMETGDFFGLHRRFRVASTPHYVTVLPRAIPLLGYDLASRRPIGEVKMTYRIFEDPTRIAGVRKYERGDPLNRINWAATARTGTLHSKIYEPSTIAGATLLLDFHQETYDVREGSARSELAITAAASLAQALYDMQERFGLVSNGRDAVDRIREEGWAGDARTRDEAQQSAQMLSDSDRLRPQIVSTGRGLEQLQMVMETLARLEVTDGLSLDQFLLEATPRIPRDTTIVAILGKMSAASAVALTSLARQGFAITAIINVRDVDRFAWFAGPLIAAGIETRHLRDEQSVAEICRQQALVR